jgi:hypothetical protein
MCAVDWQLVLDYVKALAGPLATLIGAIVVTRLALANFRSQKAIERRLDWHERMHRSLHATADLYMRAALAGRIPGNDAGEAWRRAYDESKKLGEVCGECWLYASQSGFAAVDELQQAMRDAHVEAGTRPDELATRVESTCMLAASRLSDDIRKDLRMGQLTVGIFKDAKTGALSVRAD